MADSKVAVRFRESFRGYNRDDVNEYIEQVSMRYTRRENELADQISELKKEVSAASKDEIEKLNSQIALLAAENGLLREKVRETEKKNDQLRTEINVVKSANNSLTVENEKLRIENSDKHTFTDKNENGEKAVLYDSFSTKVGSILIAANNNADEIVTKAKEEALKIKADAVISAEKTKEDTACEMEKAKDALKLQLEETAKMCLAEYGVLMDEAKKRFLFITDTMKVSLSDMSSKIEEEAGSISKKISAGFTDADNGKSN